MPIILYDAIECISKLESEYLIQIKSYDGLYGTTAAIIHWGSGWGSRFGLGYRDINESN